MFSSDPVEIYKFNSKLEAERVLTHSCGKFDFVVIRGLKVFTATNLELFEIVEMPDETS